MKPKQPVPFQRDEHLESLLAERDANKLRFELDRSRNEKDRAERYERERAKHERRCAA